MRVASFFIAILLAPTVSIGQVEIKGVSFDPTPVELVNPAQSQPHEITKMELLTMRNFYGVQISPDGKSIAFVVGQAVCDTNSYRSGLFVIGTAPGSVPKSLGTAGPPRWDFLGEWIPEEPQWSPDSRYIAYRLKTNGIWQVWRWDRDGSNPSQLTYANGDVVDFSWSEDGKQIDFDVNRSLTPEMIQQIEERGMLYEALTPVFQNKSIMQQELEQLPKETEAWTLNIDSGHERMFTRAEVAAREEWKSKLGENIVDIDHWTSGIQGNIINPKLSPDRTKVIFRLWHTPPIVGHSSFPLYIKTLGGGPPIAIDPGVYFVDSYWWSSDSKHIYYYETQGDGRSPSLYVAPVDGKQPVRLFPAPHNGYMDEFSVSDAGNVAAATLENNTVPPRIAVIDLANSTVRTLVDINPEFKNLKLSAAIRLEWVSKYGEHGHGYFVRPLDYKPGQRYPLIVTTYRSGEYFLRGGGGGEYPIQVLAANGFAVLAWDAGVAPAQATNGNFQQALLDYEWPAASLEAALNAVDKLGIVDRRRCGLTGFSHGTDIADFVVSHNPELFATAITSGMSGHDPYFYYMAPKYWKDLFKEWGLELPSKHSWPRWHEFSPSLNADRIKAPLLANSSEDDFMVAFELYTRLKEMEKPVELFLYPNELHSKIQPKHLYEIYERNVDWFKFWLQDVEDPDPSKKAQYERWRHLRDLHKKNLAVAY